MADDLGYRKLSVYQKANTLVLSVYEFTKKFTKEELFGLTSQMRRCAVSVVANLVEGYGRRTINDKIHFYYISRGSLSELEYYLDLAFQLEYLSEKDYRDIYDLRKEVGKLLNGFIRAITGSK